MMSSDPVTLKGHFLWLLKQQAIVARLNMSETLETLRAFRKSLWLHVLIWSRLGCRRQARRTSTWRWFCHGLIVVSKSALWPSRGSNRQPFMVHQMLLWDRLERNVAGIWQGKYTEKSQWFLVALYSIHVCFHYGALIVARSLSEANKFRNQASPQICLSHVPNTIRLLRRKSCVCL